MNSNLMYSMATLIALHQNYLFTADWPVDYFHNFHVSLKATSTHGGTLINSEPTIDLYFSQELEQAIMEVTIGNRHTKTNFTDSFDSYMTYDYDLMECHQGSSSWLYF